MATSVAIGTARARGRVTGLPPPPPPTVNRRRLSMHPPPVFSASYTQPPAAGIPLAFSLPHVVAHPPLEAIDENQGVPDELYDASRKIMLKIVPVAGSTSVKFFPHTSSWTPRKSFEEKAIVGATVWNKVPMNTKNFYYAEFAKKYKWRRTEDAQYRAVWEEVGANRYRNWMSKLKTQVWQKGLERPSNISADCWSSFVEHWSDPKAQTISRRNAANRRGGLADMVAPATHTGGSKPHFVHAMDKAKHGMMPKHIDLYKALHQTKEQLPCSENAKAILDAYEKKKAEDDALTSQMMSGSSCDIETHPQSIDDNERFLDVIGPPKKGRWTSVQTESSFIPITSIHRFASVTLAPPIQVSDDNRVAERVQEIIQSSHPGVPPHYLKRLEFSMGSPPSVPRTF